MGTGLEGGATASIARRYSLLFTLPNARGSFALALLLSLPIAMAESYALRFSLGASMIKAAIFELLLFSSVFIERQFLKGNPLANFRRLLAIAAASSFIWLAISILGLMVFMVSSSLQKFLTLVVLGMFLAASFKAFVFRSVFFEKFSYALPLGFLQPAAMALPMFTTPTFLEGFSGATLPYLNGLLITLAVSLYLARIDKVGGGLFNGGAIKLFQAFMKAWAADRPEGFETYIEKVSSPCLVRTYALGLEADGARSVLVVPGVHPGPLSNLGSSNLPFQLYEKFLGEGFQPFILHGVSSHDLNLPSKAEVQRFLSSLELIEAEASGGACSAPLSVKVGRATATCMAFEGHAIIMLTLAPHDMEDFPMVVKRRIEEAAASLGYKHTIIIDCHNSNGGGSGEEDIEDLVAAAEAALRELRGSPRYPFRVGASHSSELNLRFGGDLGPGGIGVLILEVKGLKYVLVAADANNARRGLREDLFDGLKTPETRVLELCTSDTHVFAGKVMTAKGYFMLGEATGVEEMVRAARLMIGRALERLRPAKFWLGFADTNVRVAGSKPWDDFAAAMDRALSFGRRWGVLLGCFILLLLFLSILL